MSNQNGVRKTQEIRGIEDFNIETIKTKFQQMEQNISYLEREVNSLKTRMTIAENNISTLESA